MGAFQNRARLPRRNDLGQLFEAGLADAGHAAEPPQQFSRGGRADPRQVEQLAAHLPAAAALAVEANSEAMRLVPNLLDQVQQGRMPLQPYRLVFLPQHVEDLFFLGDAGYRLIDDLQRFECLSGGVQLADTAVNQDQVRQRLFLCPQATVAPLDGFAQTGEVIAEHRQRRWAAPFG